MRISSYDDGGAWRAAVVVEDVLVDAECAAGAAGLSEPGAYRSARTLIAQPADVLAKLADAAAREASQIGIGRDQVRLGPPIPDPDKIICVGLNYRDHAAEAGMAVPDHPVLFSKYRNALIGDRQALELTDVSHEWDFEAELAVVIGQRVKGATVESALDSVAGYMPFNDISARDVQLRVSQWTTGKMLDGSAPCGPELVLADEVSDPQRLTLRQRLNGEVVQQSSTGAMIFPVARLIEYISTYVTLEPGDIIATGTPAGVGFKRQPPIYLKPGDLLETEVEELGTLTTPLVAEGETTKAPAAVGVGA